MREGCVISLISSNRDSVKFFINKDVVHCILDFLIDINVNDESEYLFAVIPLNIIGNIISVLNETSIIPGENLLNGKGKAKFIKYGLIIVIFNFIFTSKHKELRKVAIDEFFTLFNIAELEVCLELLEDLYSVKTDASSSEIHLMDICKIINNHSVKSR